LEDEVAEIGNSTTVDLNISVNLKEINVETIMAINEIMINGILFSHANKTISVDVNLKLVLLSLAMVLVFI
jgi:hypothetical protein